jgi:hypothetical protein
MAGNRQDAVGSGPPTSRTTVAVVVEQDPRVITVRRSTVVRVGIAALVLVAVGLGIAIGLTLGSESSPSTTKSTIGTSTSTAQVSTTSSPQTTPTLASLPAVLSCGPGSTTHVRPTRLIVGCANENVMVTDITWSSWGAATGGQGTGALKVGSAVVRAIVVVFHDVNGVFQDVSVTPSKDVSTTSTTALTTGPTRTSTTTRTTGGISPVVASQPGSGWGGD